ncbi:MAG: gamma-glutamyl-gamma-aminobutyrate hydrolase family protein [Phycisphaerae bacterium]
MADRRHAPLIGITCEAIDRGRSFAEYNLLCDHRYAQVVTDGGGHPVLLPIATRKTILRRYLEGVAGLVIVGGDDVDPSLYGEAPLRSTRVIFGRRTAFESWLYRAGRARGLPILGICYGMQLVNVLEGGTLYQQIRPRRNAARVRHRGKRCRHGVQLIEQSRLGEILGVRQTLIASDHHQAVRDLAPGFIPAAVAPDGIIEAIENPALPQVIAVQWHPELLRFSRATRRLFRAFVTMCREYQAGGGAKR